MGKAWKWLSIKSLIEHEIPFAFSSDAPVETINPFQGIYSAIERRKDNLPENPQWRAQECITAIQAINAYTKMLQNIWHTK